MSRSSLFILAGAVLPASLAVLFYLNSDDPSSAPSPAAGGLNTLRQAVPLALPVPEATSPAPAGSSPEETAGAPKTPDAKSTVRAMRQDVRWQAPMPETVFAEFRGWTGRFSQEAAPDAKAALVLEGLELAQQRRNQMADLLDQNPRRALELAVPVAVRRTLPPEVVALLEEPVAGRGDFFVVAAVPAPGLPLTVPPVERSVTLTDGREFKAFTYGQRDLLQTRTNIAVQGIALDGKLAMTEFPGRIMEPVEVADLNEAKPLCPTSGVETGTTGEEVVVDWDGSDHTFFCGPGHALNELIAASGNEAMAGGGGGGGIVAESANTEGQKKLLIIRVDFPDAAGQVVSDATLTSLINNMASHWTEMSYGKMTWAALGSGSAFTPTLRLPNGQASYASFGTMLNAARAAAAAAGFNHNNYTHEVVVTGSKPSVGFGGVAFVGGRGAWLANSQWNLGVCSHEVGHNFGLNHSGFWDTTDGTVNGDGAAVEYGNPFDQMGGASSSTNAHFGARQKITSTGSPMRTW